MVKNKKISLKILFFVVISHTAVYGLIGLKQSFYNLLIDTMGVNDVQLGVLFSIYGAVGMLSYLFGGYVSDLISEKKLILIALGISAVVHLYAMTIPSFHQLIVLFTISGITTIFGFYPASNKILYRLSGSDSSGIVFSLYYTFVTVGIGVTAVIGMILLRMWTNNEVYRGLLIFFVILHLIAICGISVSKIGEEKVKKNSDNKIVFSEIPQILKDKRVWLAALIIMANYSLLACLTYINPFLKVYFQMPEDGILKFNIFRTYILATILSPLLGWIADKIKSIIKVMGIGFIINSICLICIILSFEKNVSSIVIAILLTIFTVIVSAEKNIAVAVISELQIPHSRQGTTLGIISFIGFSPDAFFYLLAGHTIKNGYISEYRNLFIIGLMFAILGLICVAIYVMKYKKRIA